MAKTAKAELKEALDFIFATPEVYKKVKADGKVDFSDLQYLLGLFDAAKTGFEGLGNPYDRWCELQQAEKDELVDYACQKFQLPSEELESLIERWFILLYQAATLVAETTAYVKAQKQDDTPNAG